MARLDANLTLAFQRFFSDGGEFANRSIVEVRRLRNVAVKLYTASVRRRCAVHRYPAVSVPGLPTATFSSTERPALRHPRILEASGGGFLNTA